MQDVAQACVQEAYAAGVPVFFDPGPQAARIPAQERDEILRFAQAVLLTEEELALLGHADPRALLARGPELAAVKRGAAGCTVFTAAGRLDVPGFPVEAVDTAGAGDCFAAGFIYGYLQGRGLERAAVLGNALGAAMVQRQGTGTCAPGAADAAALLAHFRPDVTLA